MMVSWPAAKAEQQDRTRTSSCSIIEVEAEVSEGKAGPWSILLSAAFARRPPPKHQSEARAEGRDTPRHARATGHSARSRRCRTRRGGDGVSSGCSRWGKRYKGSAKLGDGR